MRYKECHGAIAPRASLPLEALMTSALAAQQAGRLEDAARDYQAALAREPDLFDALHMLGVVRYEQGDLAGARRLIARAIGLRPDIEAARRNLRLVDNALRRGRREADYARWIATVEKRRDAGRAPLRAAVANVTGAPRISIVMPVFDPPQAALRACLDSVLAQSYPHWELCVADDASTKPYVRAILREYAERDPRVRVAFRERNGHISAASNTALAMAGAPFAALLDHDDLLPAGALAEVAIALREPPEPSIVYSDEDKLDEHGRRTQPYFKPDWNPVLLRGQNYVSHLGVYRTSLLRDIGGFREGVEGAQDWDVVLRASERVPSRDIRHIAQVLYHWRVVEGSTARAMASKDYAAVAQQRVVEEAFARHGQRARLRRVLFDTFVEATPVVDAPRAAIVLVDRGGNDATAWRALASEAGATLDVVAAPAAALDGLPRPFSRDGAAAVNALVAGSSAGVVVVLDAACAPPSRERFDAWCAWAMQPDQGPVAALVVDRHRDMAAGPWLLDPARIAVMPWRGEPEGFWGMAGRGTLVQNLSAVSFDAVAIRRSLWTSLGGLDTALLGERFHDVDFCLRAMAAGFTPVWHPGVVLPHAHAIDEREPPPRLDGPDADAMRERWASALARDAAYNDNLAPAPDLFELRLD